MSDDAPQSRTPAKRRGSTAVNSAIERGRAHLAPRPGTIVTLALAVTAVAATWLDPGERDEGPVIVSSKTGARRLFPTLVDADPSRATIELQAPDRPPVRLIPGPEGGHQVMRGDVLLGPVDKDDFESVWSSLRMATVLRELGRIIPRAGKAAEDEETRRIGQLGVVRVSLPDASFTLALGDIVANGGVYAALDDGEPLVVEDSLAWFVEQSAQSWLSDRLLALDAGFVTGLAWGGDGEVMLGRGDDGFWRVRGGAPPALLSREAVDFRLKRLLRAKLDPFLPREVVPAESLFPWLAVTTGDGGSRTLLVGGACPDHPDRRLVDRGPGLFGCLPAEELEPWPLHDPNAGMIESRLVPHSYARIVQIDLGDPARRSLIRRGGSWSLSQGGRVEAVSDDEVRRWYASLSRVEVALLSSAVATPEGEGQGEGPEEGDGEGDGEGSGDTPPGFEGVAFEADLEIVVHADTNETLRISCHSQGDPVLCVRDDGPVLRVLSELPKELSFEAETFAERRLIDFSSGEARAVEILPGGLDGAPNEATVRQSVRMDMGIWSLSSPSHADGGQAVDEVRVETLLWGLSQLRAERWVDGGAPREGEAPTEAPPSRALLRRIHATVIPEQGRERSVEVELFEGCEVEVEGHRRAEIPRSQCEALSGDLLFDDPLRFWLERARSLELRSAEDAKGRFLRRDRDRFVRDDGGELVDEALLLQLQGWIDWRSAGLRGGEPPSPARWFLDIRREGGVDIQVETGVGWARIQGADWFYVEAEGGESPEEPAPPGGDLDEDLDGDGLRPAEPGELGFDPEG